MARDVLMIATMDGLESCTRMLSEQLGTNVELASNRRSGMEAIRRMAWGAVIVEDNLAENDPEWADQIWSYAGTAVTLEVNFAISGCSRLAREIKAALERRRGEQQVLRKALALELEQDLRSSLTGLLLQSELALQDPQIPPSLEPKLRHVLELAGAIRERLRWETQ